MTTIQKFFKTISLPLLRQQKNWLYAQKNELADGVLNLLDALEDEAGKPEPTVLTINEKGYANMDEVTRFVELLPKTQRMILLAQMVDEIEAHLTEEQQIAVRKAVANTMYG